MKLNKSLIVTAYLLLQGKISQPEFMKAYKLIATLSFVLALAVGSTPYNAQAKCSSNILRNVCNLCEDRALSKLNIDSVCPPCEVVNCPQPSLACIRPDSFEKFLDSNYTLAGIVTEENETIYRLNIRKEKELPGTFTYDVRLANFRPIVRDSVGFLLYDVINFNLPVVYNEEILSYNCIGVINNTSAFKGFCSTIAPDEEGNPKPYGFEFNALPNESPLQ